LARVTWFNRLLMACIVFCLTVWGVTQTFGTETAWAQSKFKEIRAARFIVEDENGHTRGVLSSSDGPNADERGPALSLLDENGLPRAMLMVSKDGPALRMYDENRKLRMLLVSVKGGTSLSLQDENQTPRAGLAFLDKEGQSIMGLHDGNGKVRACVDMDTRTGWPAVRLLDEKGEGRIALVLLKEGPVVRLYGAGKKQIWSAP
jgi:hypothetical protein